MTEATLNNYSDVQTLLNNFVAAYNVPVPQAPHGIFWQTLSYEEFVTGNVPNIGIPILTKGDSSTSYIIEILKGAITVEGTTIPQMPRPNPPYDSGSPTQDQVVQQLAAWIDADCPNG